MIQIHMLELPPSEWSIDYDSLDHERDDECRAEACRRIAVSEQTYNRWRKEYGGLKTDQARRSAEAAVVAFALAQPTDGKIRI